MNAIICLIDESSLMDVTVKPSNASRKPLHKMSAVANSINGFLGRLSESNPACKVAVIGYSIDDNDEAVVEARLGDGFVRASELGSIVQRVESRVQKIPSGDGFTFDTRDVDVSIWYEATASGKSCQIAGFDFTNNLIANSDDLDSVVLVHIFGGSSADGNPVRSVKALDQLGKTMTVLQVHVGSTESVPATAFPAKQATLTSSLARDLFNRSSSLDDQWRQSLRDKGFSIGTAAQGLVYNSHMVDLAKVLATVGQVAGTWTEIAAVADDEPIEDVQKVADEVVEDIDAVIDVNETAVESESVSGIDDVEAESQEAESQGAGEAEPSVVGDAEELARQLVVLAIDCSVEDPFASSTNNLVTSHANNVGNFLEQALKVGREEVDLAIVTYGNADDGSERIQSRIESLPDDPFFPASETENLALRIDSFVEELPNGSGGLISIPHDRPVLVEFEPASYCSPENAFGEVAKIANAWRNENEHGMIPIVVHLTRGEFEGDDLESAVNNLKESSSSSVLVYHWISSQKPVVSSYPSPGTTCDDESAFLNKLIANSSPLVNAGEIAAENSSIPVDGVGLVCNSRFDLILDPVTRARESAGSAN